MYNKPTKTVKVRYKVTFEATIQVPIDATPLQIVEEMESIDIPEDFLSKYVLDTFEPVTEANGDPVCELVPQSTDFVIPAEVHTDDLVYSAQFDALEWFKQASRSEIYALAECGWGGDYAADAVAKYSTAENVGELFDYIANGRPKLAAEMGFECHVNKEKALAWIKVHISEALYDDLVL